MQILRAIIDSLATDAPVEEVRRGLFWTAVVSRRCGLASTMMIDMCSQEGKDASEIRPLTGRSATELAHLAFSKDISEASLGLAAINSLLDINESGVVDVNAGDILIEQGADRNVSVIGHFPFTDDLRKVARNLWVIEKWPRPGDLPEKDAQVYLPISDIIAISSTTLINHTLSDVLYLCGKESLKMLLGPTTPLTSVLFDYGIDMISGSVVMDKATALKYIGEGANFRQLKSSGCIRLVTMRA